MRKQGVLAGFHMDLSVVIVNWKRSSPQLGNGIENILMGINKAFVICTLKGAERNIYK